jgi:diadenosine tetraphosphate (Ap4A) HIT family hydrolase
MPHRRRSTEVSYIKTLRKQPAKKSCPFCFTGSHDRDVIEETKHLLLIKNIYPYDIFDDIPVSDHMLIVPKRHIVHISDYTAAENREFMQIVAKYDKKGYSLYARSDSNTNKTVIHQHSHLIRTKDRRIRFALFARRPYIFWYR